ncbi:hypothetical protein DLJ74_01555 [Gracilibacillus dipsosauri]|uniref:Uncharacterized protein n=1 Tax=Gracilibacillus dipsosauri TaxID=178340 RepID=A0A317L3T6_9BACI|nr:hypothetical protein DLJ74_01555 [Gracilibacillus dipsosauri]
MNSDRNITFSSVLFVVGYCLGILVFLYQVFISSDIPISFTTTEALQVQILHFISTFFIFVAYFSSNNKILHYIMLGFITIALVIQIIINRNMMLHEQTAVVILSLAPLLHLSLLLLTLIYKFCLRSFSQKRD